MPIGVAIGVMFIDYMYQISNKLQVTDRFSALLKIWFNHNILFFTTAEDRQMKVDIRIFRI